MLRSSIPVVWCSIYLIVLVVLAYQGGITVNKKPLPFGLALIVGPLVCLVLGIVFTLIGLAFLSPLWIWVPFLRT